MMPLVLIHTNKLLPYSETFIKHHIEGLKEFTPAVIYSQSVEGLEVSAKTVCTATGRFPKLSEYAFKLGALPSNLIHETKKLSPVLIHSHFGQNGYAAVPLGEKLGIPNVTTFHGFDVTIENLSIKSVGILHYLFRKNVERLARNGDLFIAVSNFIKQKLIELGFPAEKIVVNYLGIDCSKFAPEHSEHPEQREKTIVCVARHTEYKGLKYLIDAFAKVEQKLGGYSLKLIGDGPQHEELRTYAAKISSNIFLTGRLPQNQIITELQRASLYVQPSIRLSNGHEEALALTIVEAQACGLPAIVFDSGGMPEAIIPGVSGLVAEQKNSNDLADKILSLLEDPRTLSRMAEAARDNVYKNHNHETQTKKLESIYKSLLQGEGHSS